ncbi:MAG: type III secretion system export apparatus subunit SctR [Pseudomonadota bacterium]
MDSIPNPVVLLPLLLGLSLAPFLAIMVSSYLKIVIVLTLVRNALGLQQVPPNMMINGLAIILSVYVMAPTGHAVHQQLGAVSLDSQALLQPENRAALSRSVEPVRSFLEKHADDRQTQFFVQAASRLWPEDQAQDITESSLLVLVPAFTVTELIEAFETGFMLFLPFVVIDLVISSILLAMGMFMVSPMMVSLPFKLLLFVMADGWTRLLQSLVLGYQ